MVTTAMLVSKSQSPAIDCMRLRTRQIGYALGAAVVSVVAGTILMMLVDGGLSADEANRATAASQGVVLLIASVLIVAPLVETLFLGWILLLLLDRGINRHFAVVLSAALWTGIHLFRGVSGFSVFFAFVAFSYLFVFRRNPPHSDGYLLAMMAHFFYNLILLAAAYCGGLI